MAKKTPEQLRIEQAKAERLAAALRENLRRRKAQARGAGDVPDAPDPTPEGSGGIGG